MSDAEELGAPSGRSWADVQTVGLILLPALLVALGGVIGTSGLLHDVELFRSWWDQVALGALPGRDLSIQYPPGALLPILLPGIVGGTREGYLIVFAALNATAAGLVGLVLTLLLRDSPVRLIHRVLTAWALLVLPITPIVAWRFDLLAAVAAVAGVALLSARRPGDGGVLLAVGGLIKVFPVFLAPVLAGMEMGARGTRPAARFLLAAVFTGLIVVGLAVAIGGEGAFTFLRLQVIRELQVESVGASALLFGDLLGIVDTGIAWSDTALAWYVTSDLSGAVMRLLDLLLLGGIAGLMILAWLRGRSAATDARRIRLTLLFTLAAATMLLLLVANKVFSPQYLVWLLPFAVLLPRREQMVLFAVSVLTILIVPIGYEALLRQEPLLVVLLLLRNLLLVGLLLRVVHRLMPRGRRAPSLSTSTAAHLVPGVVDEPQPDVPVIPEPPPAPEPRLTIGGVVPAILVVLIAGFALRFLLAFVVFPQSGLWSDIKLFGQWSLTLADHGPWGFYTNVAWSDYTPGYMWVLWLHGIAVKVATGLLGGAAPEAIPYWIKLPGIIADLLVAWVFYRAVRRWHGEAWGVTVAAVFLFLPVTWYETALWGQVDAVGVLVGALALIWLIDRRPELAAGAAMAAVLIKPQFGVFLPVVAVVLLRRHLRRPTRPFTSPRLADLRGWWAEQDREGPLRIVTSAIAGLIVLLVIAVPFDLETRAPAGLAAIPVVGDIAGLLSLVSTTAASYGVLTANAFNPWALVGPTPLTTAIGGSYQWTYDTLPILGIPASLVGALAFLAVLLSVIVFLWRRQDREAILIAAVTLAAAFFILPTRVHERYLFAAVATGILLLPYGRAWWAWLATASGVLLVNMHAILSLPFRGYGTVEMRTLPFVDLTRTPLVVTIAALACIPVMAWPIWAAWRRPPTPDAESGGESSEEVPELEGGAAVAPPAGPDRLTRIASGFREGRLPGPSLAWSVLILVGVSAIAALAATRFSGFGGGWLFNWDLPHLNASFATWLHEAVSQGRLPGSIDEVGLGYPVYATGLNGQWYPPHWIFHLTSPLTALDLSRLFHLTLAGTGAGLIVLRFTGVRSAAMATAVLAAGSGGIVAKLEWIEVVIAYAWIPWVLLPLVGQSRGTLTWTAFLGAGAVWGIQLLSGHPPTWVLTGIAVAVLVIIRLRSWQALPGLALFAVTGVLAGAVVLIPYAVLTPLSVRSEGLDLGVLFRYSATPFDFLGFAFANAFVPAAVPEWNLLATWHPGSVFGFLESYAYLGLPALLLAAVGLRVRRARWLIAPAIVLILIPVIGALRPAIWAEIPLINGLRHPVRAYLLVGLLLAIGAGFGVARLGRPRPTWVPGALLVILVAGYALVSLVASGFPALFADLVRTWWDQGAGAPAEAITALAADTLSRPFPLVLEVALGAATIWLIGSRLRRPAARSAGIALALIPLLLIPGLNALRPASAFTYAEDPLVVAIKGAAPNRVALVNEPGLGFSNQLAANGIRDIHPFVPLELAPGKEVVEIFRSGIPDVGLARALGIDLLVTFGDFPCVAGAEIGRVDAYAARLCRVDGVQAGPFWFPAELLVPGAEPGSLLRPEQVEADPAAAVAAAVPALTIARDDGSATFEVTAPRDGWLFIDRSWYPWWETSVDGVPVTARELWSGQVIPIAAGTHRIEQRFVPRDAQLGALISIVTLLLVAGFLLRRNRERVRMVGARAGALLAGGSVVTAVPDVVPDAEAASPVPPADRPRPRLFLGRIGRRELTIALILFLGLGAIRLHHLERPFGYYFDEVLYGRAATEWLQGWRYGRLHETNEWTHPPLSKELMAASIELTGGHEVAATGSLGEPVVDAVIEPGYATGGGPAGFDPLPSWLIAATPDALLATPLGDPTSPEIRLEIPDIRRLALHPDDGLLWVSGGEGVVVRFQTVILDLLADRLTTLDDLADDEIFQPTAELPGPVDGLWAFPGGGAAALVGETFYVLGPDGIVGQAETPGLTDAVWVGTDADPRLALVIPSGIRIVSVPDLAQIGFVPLDRRPLGADLVRGTDDENRARGLLKESRLYVATRDGLVTIGGLMTDAPFREASLPMPGPVTDVRWNESTNLVHVLGAQGERPTIYVVEPRGLSVFADAELPAEPVAWGLDVRDRDPGADRQRAITVAADGSVAEVGIGGTAFATRLPGAILGALAGALLFLLLALISRRRIVGLIGAGLIATETFLFSESRLATPEIMTMAFVIGGWTLLAWLVGQGAVTRHRWRAILGFPLVGILIGLAAATKWTGLYPLAGIILFLLLADPRLRRLALLLTGVAAVVVSGASLVSDPPALAVPLVLLAVLGIGVLWVRRWDARALAAEALLPLRMTLWAIVSIVGVTLIVYVVSFIPYLFLDAGRPQLIAGWPPDNTGETFLQLQGRMYAFHEGLRENHGAGTPWWSWPLMLKPLWAYMDAFDGARAATVLMPINPVVVWLSLPLLAWAVWRVARRFDPALLLLVLAFAVQWLPWARVERVAFFYHYATVLPFALALLAIFLARLRAGVSPRGWRAARAVAVTVVFLPALFWLLTPALCGTIALDPAASVCAPQGFSARAPLMPLLGAVVIAVAVGGATAWWLGRRERAPERAAIDALLAAVGVATILLAATVVGRIAPLAELRISLSPMTGFLPIAAALALPVAALIVTARTPRRVVPAVLAASLVCFLVFYPFLSALPVDTDLPYVAQALLPTWETGFRFAPGSGALPAGLLVLGVPILVVGAIAWWLIGRVDARRARREGSAD